MAVDRARALALTFDPLTVDVERGRLRFFAQATGETDPVYVDVTAAAAAGHRDLPVPPTFYFSLSLERPEPMAYLTEIGVDLRRILHGEQVFEYHAMAYARDTLVVEERITEVVTKRGGAMELVTKQTEVRRGTERVATCRSVIVALAPLEEASA